MTRALLFLWLGLMSAKAEVAIRYDAREGEIAADPATQGWKAVKGSEALGAPGEESEENRSWKIGAPESNVNLLTYNYEFSDKGILSTQDWIASARLRVKAASKAKKRDAFLEVEDGKSEWVVGFVKLRDEEELCFVNREGQYESLGQADVSSDFFDLQMKYSADSEEVAVSVNGTPVGTLTRENVPKAAHFSRVFIQWGDGSVAALPTDARSEVFWQSVKLDLSPAAQ